MKTSTQTAVEMSSRTVERLVVYRILLEELRAQDKTHVFSKEMAKIVGNTAAQVRRDLMAVGYMGNTRNGYQVADLLEAVNRLLEPKEGITLAIAGVGNLGRSLLGYFSLQQPRFRIVAVFDNDDQKVGRTIFGYHVRHTSDMADVLAGNLPQAGVVAVPAEQAQKVADAFTLAGVRGIVNFAPAPLRVPAGVWLENMHITATFEKVAFFSRLRMRGEQV